MRLSELKDGQSGVICRMTADGDFAKRLCDMGFTKGESVERVCEAALHSPILFRVKGSDIALRRCDAGRIEVTV